MNAASFNTILPQMLIRHSRAQSSSSAAVSARHEPERIVTFTAAPEPLSANLRSTALHAAQELERRDIAPLLKLVAWIFQPMAARKHVTLRVEAPEIGLFATCQELRIQRVLENLLSNAVRHAPMNSAITLAARIEDGWLCVWVEDQGPGVPLAEQARLFEGNEPSFGEYTLGVNDDNRGLVASREIVSTHGGEILMYNRVGGGAHFEFRLPSTNGRHGPTRPGKPNTFTVSLKAGLIKMMPAVGKVA
ncbi:MAG TPA: ATP-binding protein [Opitutales bacterium]|nr:ATP-binding protein [Opitutales bacterium]